jgi:hypothetical protein
LTISLEKGGYEMTRVRKNKGLLALFMVSMLLTAGCSSSSNTSGINDPYEKQDISGVWLGYFGNTFTVGIITKETNEFYTGRFICQDAEDLRFKQLISPDGSFLSQTPNSAIFLGYLEDCSWSTSGVDYSNLSPQSLYLSGPAVTKSVFGGPPFGAYSYGNKSETNMFVSYYNTTYDVLPNVNNISGQWEIRDAIYKDNTVVLMIQPNTTNTIGTTISGHDNRGNSFDGTITIYYSPIETKPHNVYEVFLKLNNTIDLNGLAAYVLECNTLGITIPQKTLAIGALNEDRSYSLNGLAEFIK